MDRRADSNRSSENLNILSFETKLCGWCGCHRNVCESLKYVNACSASKRVAVSRDPVLLRSSPRESEWREVAYDAQALKAAAAAKAETDAKVRQEERASAAVAIRVLTVCPLRDLIA